MCSAVTNQQFGSWKYQTLPLFLSLSFSLLTIVFALPLLPPFNNLQSESASAQLGHILPTNNQHGQKPLKYLMWYRSIPLLLRFFVPPVSGVWVVVTVPGKTRVKIKRDARGLPVFNSQEDQRRTHQISGREAGSEQCGRTRHFKHEGLSHWTCRLQERACHQPCSRTGE